VTKPHRFVPSDWLSIGKVFARVNDLFPDPRQALFAIRRAATDRRILGLRLSTDGARHELLPAEFWSTVRLEVHTDIGNRVYVKKRTSDQPSPPAGTYFFGRIGVIKEWPLLNEPAAGDEPVQEVWPRKSVAGRSSRADWEKIILKAVHVMLKSGPPETLTELCKRVGGDPDDTQLKNHLRPFYNAFKEANAK